MKKNIILVLLFAVISPVNAVTTMTSLFNDVTLLKTTPQTLESLQAAVKPFQAIKGCNLITQGFINPIGDELIKSVNNGFLLMYQKQTAYLSSAIISQYTDEKENQIEIQENRLLSSSEKTQLKKEMTCELIPRAFQLKLNIPVYIDADSGLVLFGSADKADVALFKANLAANGLVVDYATTVEVPRIGMTQWVINQQYPTGFSFTKYAYLATPEEKPYTKYLQGLSLNLASVLPLLEQGYQVTGLGIVIDGNYGILRYSYNKQNEITLSSLKMNTALKVIETTNKVADFEIRLNETLNKLIPYFNTLITSFGGLTQ